MIEICEAESSESSESENQEPRRQNAPPDPAFERTFWFYLAVWSGIGIVSFSLGYKAPGIEPILFTFMAILFWSIFCIGRIFGCLSEKQPAKAQGIAAGSLIGGIACCATCTAIL